ncbi:hypothetical protein C8J56DRAFT_1038952 [Mycena floridula]|nr:hypothetical protein C8J56DRAFT_1038952 [Mycena floridula]
MPPLPVDSWCGIISGTRLQSRNLHPNPYEQLVPFSPPQGRPPRRPKSVLKPLRMHQTILIPRRYDSVLSERRPFPTIRGSKYALQTYMKLQWLPHPRWSPGTRAATKPKWGKLASDATNLPRTGSSPGRGLSFVTFLTQQTSHLARVVDVKATDSDDRLVQKTLLGWPGFAMSSAIPAAATQ